MVRIATTQPSRPASSAPSATPTTAAAASAATTTTTTTTTAPATTAPAPLTHTSPAQAVASTVAASLAALASTDPTAAATKRQKLALSPFAFFRGTVEIFAAQHAKTSTGATVLLNGDVHPMNFGCLRGKDGDAVFALNDFDEAARGAFSYDVKRGAAGFALLCDEQKLSPSDRDDVVAAFVGAYVDALDDNARATVDAGHARGAVKDALQAADGRSRRELLDELTAHGALRPTKDLTPAPQLKHDVELALRRALHDEKLVVKDVAERFGAGIGSLGARRLLVLLENDTLLELKTAAPPALSSSTPSSSRLTPSAAREAARVVKAAAAQTRGADRFSTTVTVASTSFVVREKSPQRMPLDLFHMGKRALLDVAAAAGAVLAGAHLGPEKSERDDVAARVLGSMGKKKDFKAAVLAFASAEAERTTAAWTAFSTVAS